jgi:hypothetical protein
MTIGIEQTPIARTRLKSIKYIQLWSLNKFVKKHNYPLEVMSLEEALCTCCTSAIGIVQ